MKRVAALKPAAKTQKVAPDLTRFVGGGIGFVVGYLGSMVAYNLDNHPIHWLSAFVLTVPGVLTGHFYAYFRNRRIG